MGYWSQTPTGESFAIDSPLVWGDAPADVMDDAIAKIVKTFERDLDRRPTREEITAGLLFSLSIYEDEYGPGK